MPDTSSADISPAKAAPSFALLTPAQIAPDPDQPRKTFDESALTELANSIGEHGVIEPVIVRPVSDPGDVTHDVTHTLIAGERRWRAAQLAGLAQIPAIIRTDLAGEDLAVVQVLENLQRADLTLPETAAGVAKLVAAMGTGKTARQLGKSEGWVSKHARLSDLPECITACIDAGTLTSADMAHDLKRMMDLVDELGGAYHYSRDQLLDEAADGTLTRVQLRSALDNFKRFVENKRREAKEREEREQHASNAAAGTFNLSPEQQREDAAETARREAAYRAEEEQRAARDAAIQAYRDAAQPLMTRLYLDLCAATGVTPQTYDDAPEEYLWEHHDLDEPGIAEAREVSRWLRDEDIPPPEAFEQRLLAVNLPLLPAQLRRLIAVLPDILAEPVAADHAPIPQTENEPHPALPAQFAAWCEQHLIKDETARVQCVDVHQAFNATLIEAERISLTSNRWSELAERAGLTKKRFKTGYAYLGVRMGVCE
jgi:ParB/RepB/Spo0J family partition protein